MKKAIKVKYKDFGHFIIRCPSLPYSEDTPFSYEKIKENALFMESLYISSPEFYEEIANTEQLNEKHKLTLLKYWNRIRTRSTPFGIFSGIGIGNIDDDINSIIISSQYERAARLDMSFFSNLISYLQNRKEVKTSLRYFANDTFYKAGNNYRYYFVKKAENNKDFKFDVIHVEISGYLKKIIDRSKNGVLLSELFSMLGVEFSEEEIRDYIDELIDSQIILSELTPQITGEPLLHKIIELSDRAGLLQISQVLKQINDLLNNINEEKDQVKAYRSIENMIRKLNVEYKRKELIQVDLKRKFEKASLNKETINEIKEAISYLNSLEYFENENQSLKKFISAFQEIYEEEEMPLLHVLDVDIGLGYPIEDYGNNYTNSLIKDFELPAIEIKPKKSSVLKEIISRKREYIQEIRLEDEKADLKNDINNFYPVFYTSLDFVNIGKQALPRLKYLGDRSGVKLLTRFSHADKDIEDLIFTIIRKEQELSNEVLAEIVHLPNPRLGNISTRPHIRDYEITCLTASDREKEHRIPLNDLMISVKNNRILLRSKKLNKIIKPVLSTAHNYRLSDLSVYRFLCDLQFQDTRIISFPFDWDLPYTPRIRYKNVIISLATWIIRTEELEHIFTEEDEDLLLLAIRKWKDGNHIPDLFLLCIGDNELLIESGKAEHIKMFLKEIKNKKTVKIVEFLFDEQHSVLKDREGKAYRQEVILPLYCDAQ
ncbi:lantibiotic dehydratase family protein [Chryseobacterium contaminans]|uniref:lantibiotic dehydratase family protein n=1 Tax=Chryseobacterium contaminans TaxID=1423959 RepID=UPI003017E413